MPFTGNDFAHLFFGLPVMAYGHLIALEAYNALGKGRKIPKWGEGTFLLVFGFIIFVIDIFGYRGCEKGDGGGARTCRGINEMHMLIGLFMMALGAVLLMHMYMKALERGSLWMTPICLVVIGIFMMGHEQSGPYGTVIHTAFGVLSLIAASLRGLAIIDPQKWGIFTAYLSTITGICFVTGSDSIEKMLSANYTGYTVLLGVCTLAGVLLIPFMLFIAYMNKGSYKHLVSVHKLAELPLIGGKF